MRSFKDIFKYGVLFTVVGFFSCKNPLKTHEVKDHAINRTGGEYCIFTVKIDKDNGRLNPGDEICIVCGNATDCPKNTIYKIKVKEGGETKRYEVSSSTRGMEKKCERCPDEVVYGFEKVK